MGYLFDSAFAFGSSVYLFLCLLLVRMKVTAYVTENYRGRRRPRFSFGFLKVWPAVYFNFSDLLKPVFFHGKLLCL